MVLLIVGGVIYMVKSILQANNLFIYHPDIDIVVVLPRLVALNVGMQEQSMLPVWNCGQGLPPEDLQLWNGAQ